MTWGFVKLLMLLFQRISIQFYLLFYHLATTLFSLILLLLIFQESQVNASKERWYEMNFGEKSAIAWTISKASCVPVWSPVKRGPGILHFDFHCLLPWNSSWFPHLDYFLIESSRRNVWWNERLFPWNRKESWQLNCGPGLAASCMTSETN